MKKVSLFVSFFVIFCAFNAFAKFKVEVPADKSYDFKSAQNIVIMPITSNNVDYGKVDKDRLNKIKSILEKTKQVLREQMVEGLKLSEANKTFSYKAPNKKSTTLLVKSNIELFDNGNMLTRTASPFGGSAKVRIRTAFLNGQNNKVVAEVVSDAKGKGSLVGGGMDSEALLLAAKTADAKTFQYMKKLTGLKYKSMANIGDKAKIGVKDQKKVYSEEKQEFKKGKK